MLAIHKAIVEELNRRVAHLMGHQEREVDVTFVPLIDRREFVRGGVYHRREVLGQYIKGTNRIIVKDQPNWGVALIEELVHFYQPDWDHRRVKRAVVECVQVMKARATEQSKSE